MGGAVSSGRNNDDLIDNLLEADYIKTSPVERVFRAVDRAEYFLPEARADAYKDLAWKNGNLHLSAPCIYSEVMEGLSLEKGLSFLNLGSGTGYLSTMVGLILGGNGINHGVEIHGDVVHYANRKLEEFKRYSGAIDEYDFCEPKFIQGNCLCLTSECASLYDRIYCGAACPEQYELYMKNLLKTGGILVMPLNEQLLQIKRISETEWSVRPLLPVSFASLIMPTGENQEWVHPIEIEPLSLQILCRSAIRNLLRRNIEVEHPPVKKLITTTKVPKKKRALKRLVVPLFDTDSDSDEEPHVRLVGNNGRGASLDRDDNIFSFFLGLGNGRSYFSAADRSEHNRESSNEANSRETETADQAMETDTNESTDESSSKNGNGGTQTYKAVIEHHEVPEPNGAAQENENRPDEEQSLEAINEINDVIVECLNVLRRGQERGGENGERNGDSDMREESQASTSGNAAASQDNKRKTKREKFDSGLGDEIIETQDSSDEDEPKSNTQSSCEDESSKKRNKRDSSSENEGDKRNENETRVYRSPYTEHMKAKIQQLPLPTILKKYLNFYREF